MLCDVLVFADINVNHKVWFTFSGETDRPGALVVLIFVSNDFMQIINFPNQISDCVALMNSFVLSNPNICSVVAFWVILIMLLSQFQLPICFSGNTNRSQKLFLPVRYYLQYYYFLIVLSDRLSFQWMTGCWRFQNFCNNNVFVSFQFFPNLAGII